MEISEEVEEHIELVNLPEERIRLGPNFGMSKDKDGAHDDPEDDPGDSSQSLEEPVGDVWFPVAGEPELWRETVKMLQRLSGDMVEVGEMTNSVEDGEEESGAGHDLVEDDVGVEGDVLVEGPLLHLGDQVPADCQQQQAVAEGERCSGASGDSDTNTHHMT